MPDWNELKTLGNTLTRLKLHRPPSRLCADRWIELVQNLPNLESFALTFALEVFCDHSKSKERFTLGVKKFAFSDLLHFCPSFLDRIDLSTTVCRSSSITCLSHPQSDSEISEEDAMKAVLPHMKRLLSQIMIDNSSFRICDSLIVIDSNLLGPAIHSRELGQTVITKHSHHFYVCFHRYAQLTEYHRPFVYPTLLDLVRTISTSVELAETCIDDRPPTFDWDHYFDVLVHCQNIRFMQGVSLSWWKWLCKRLIPAAGEATNDATKPLFPHLRSIDFEKKIQIKERPVEPSTPYMHVDQISFDELKAFCKHRANIGVPLEWVSIYDDGIFEMDDSGEIKAEPDPWDTVRRAIKWDA
ncbi:hypothetical protein AGABI1DRAFT_94516 [Agaricus bisporus var. burnettii JB137-S8]|uniref:Uncharacterized protein n=1 Tax=Agaricus bisporus var. burnettii (strain JB137-S8 / ATCC MYA-4627 / FGSC 10392) TaxID=597362 RepID=K5WKP5_AGABU|nr:uncharacterized protein AGABI1DRAFT_94516 [Agaricus bisporus var. burnettii JB137-S8]EKM75876.1 hypothetical protein AGABI1DRAFT_94516 [Agaricus bisporus var. burnettii JB137-S8]